jgi:hypothetical protein
MVGDRSRQALVLSALGAILLAVSVFLPWYGVSFTAAGVAFVQHVGDQVASQYGNATLQSYMSGLHSDLGGIAGQQLTAVSAHQALKDMNVFLLLLAGLALLDALVPLARSASPLPVGAGASVVLLGGLATACVVYRMAVPPTPTGNLVALSLREGAWLALLGSLTMVFAGLWPLIARAGGSGGESQVESAWSQLSGWTPGA